MKQGICITHYVIVIISFYFEVLSGDLCRVRLTTEDATSVMSDEDWLLVHPTRRFWIIDNLKIRIHVNRMYKFYFAFNSLSVVVVETNPNGLSISWQQHQRKWGENSTQSATRYYFFHAWMQSNSQIDNGIHALSTGNLIFQFEWTHANCPHWRKGIQMWPLQKSICLLFQNA